MSDEQIIIIGVLILAAISFISAGDHPVVTAVVSGLLGYLSKSMVDNKQP